jgi:hypothetical protein
VDSLANDFIAIADPWTEYGNPLSNVIATADFYQH